MRQPRKVERGRALDRAGVARCGLTAQHRIDPRQQLARVERLGQVIVSAHLEAEDAVDVLAARGEHDDRRLRFRAHLAAQAEAVLAGQHHVEHQEIHPVVGHGLGHLAAVGGGRDIAGIGAQVFRDEGPRLAVVLDDKDIGRSLGHTDSFVRDSGKAAQDFCFSVFLKSCPA